MGKNFRIVMNLTDEEMKVANKIFTEVAHKGWSLDYGWHGARIANKFFPAQWQAKIEKDVSDRKEFEKQCKDAGLLAHSAEEQELEMWKTLALAMSKLVLEHEK